jgi:hypothetical protein
MGELRARGVRGHVRAEQSRPEAGFVVFEGRAKPRLIGRLAARTTGRYMASWGITPQEPMKKAYEPSPGRQTLPGRSEGERESGVPERALRSGPI